MEKRTTDLFTYVNQSGSMALSGNYQLTNQRADHYDSVEIHAKRQFANGHTVFASYTHSSAHTNAALDYMPTVSVRGQRQSGTARVGCSEPHSLLGLAALAVGENEKKLGCCVCARLAYRIPVYAGERQPAGNGRGRVGAFS